MRSANGGRHGEGLADRRGRRAGRRQRGGRAGGLREALLASDRTCSPAPSPEADDLCARPRAEPADMPVVRGILRNAAEDDYQMMSIILGIVDSFPFQMRTNRPEPDAAVTIAQTKE
jgi:hypothetical protein